MNAEYKNFYLDLPNGCPGAPLDNPSPIGQVVQLESLRICCHLNLALLDFWKNQTVLEI